MKIFYQRAYSIAPYLTERIGFEMDSDLDPILDSHDRIGNQVAMLKEICDNAHKELNPHLYNESVGSYSISDIEGMQPMLNSLAKQPAPNDKIQSFISTIEMCKTVEGLLRFKPSIEKENNQQLTEAFEKKLKELQ